MRNGDWILTFTGREFYPIDARPEDVAIEDIAHALSLLCRFGGHCEKFYSVVEHCLRVAELVPESDALWALLHDASEAYLIDLPRPIKRHTQIGKFYREAEDNLMAVITDRFNLGPEPMSIGRADKAMLCVEARELLPVNSWWEKWACFLSGHERAIGEPMSPKQAETAFLSRFSRLLEPAA